MGKTLLLISIVGAYLGASYWFILDDWESWAYPAAGIIMLLLSRLIKRTPPQKKEPDTQSESAPTLMQTVPQKHYKNELDMAKRVQQGLLNIDSPDLPGIRIAKRCIPAESVGGDFYTFINKDFKSLKPKPKTPGIVEYFDQQDNYLGVVIGDVAGHGVSSALIMALSSGLLTEVGKGNKSPSKTLESANNDILRYIENSQITHVTVFFGIINTATNRFTYAKAGHPPALLIHKEGQVEELSSEGVFLGMFSDEDYEEKSIQLHSGDRLFFYTDGITETKSPSGELFGVDRFKEILLENKSQDIESLMNTTFDELDRYANYRKQRDDRSLVILEID